MANPKYRPSAVDADGREYLTAGAGTVLGSWTGSPRGEWGFPAVYSFCGAARDGLTYDNGVLCYQDSFGTVAGGVNSHSWGTCDSTLAGFPDVWQPNPGGGNYWDRVASNAPVVVSDNVVRLSSPGIATVGNIKYTDCLMSSWRWMIQGNFEIKLYVRNFGGGVNWQAVATRFMVFSSDAGMFDVDIIHKFAGAANYVCQGRYADDAGATRSWLYIIGETTAFTPPATTVLRIVRSGNQFTGSVNRGAGWEGNWVRNAVNRLSRSRMLVGVLLGQHERQWTSGTCVPTTDVEFELVSGTVITQAPWALISPSANRGARADFPENYLIIWTATELSIIDLDEEKLWWRLTNPQAPGTYLNHLLCGFTNTTNISDAWMDDEQGMLYVVLRDTATTGNSTIVEIDFPRWRASTFRSTAGGPPPIGGSFNWYCNSSVWRGFDQSSYGIVQDSLPNDAWQKAGSYKAAFQSNSDLGNQSHSWTEGNYTYRALALSNGVQLFKWRTGNTDDNPVNTKASWTGVTDVKSVRISTDGDLVFHDATNIYVVYKATWQAAFLGTFGVDLTWATPGTRSLDTQYYLDALLGGVFLARDEGVYFRAWADAGWTLLYGKSGSGATYTILPTYDKINVISIGTVESKNILVAGFTNGVDYYVSAISITSNSLAGTKDVTSDIVSAPIRVAIEAGV